MEYNFNFRLQSPFSMVISGPSGCGKTFFTKQLLTGDHVDPPFNSVTFFYSEWQDSYRDMPAHVRLIQGMPESLDVFLEESPSPTCLIFDDMMNECVNNNMIADGFTKKRHHKNATIILLIQNLFSQGKAMRTIHLNTQYLVLFANTRDKSQFSHLARQLEPNNSKKLLAAYADATSKPFKHFMIDLKTSTPNPLRYRSDTLSNENQIVYPIGGV